MGQEIALKIEQFFRTSLIRFCQGVSFAVFYAVFPVFCAKGPRYFHSQISYLKLSSASTSYSKTPATSFRRSHAECNQFRSPCVNTLP